MNLQQLLVALPAPAFLVLALTIPTGPAPSPQDEGKEPMPHYVGEKSCKMCHFKQHRSWSKSHMADAFKTLMPGQKAEIKEKSGLDPNKDYTQDAACLPCHTTGYGQPGGYPALDPAKPWNEEQTKLASERQGVQCESCHGPNSLTLPVFKEIKDQKRPYTSEELAKLGLVLPHKENCITCHNENSPTRAKDAKFDYEAMLKKEGQIHEHVPLQFRQEKK